MDEVGMVVGNTETGKFVIALPKDTKLMENEYVVTKVRERDILRDVVGRVAQMGALSEILTHETTYDSLMKLVSRDIDVPKIYAEIETIGYLDEGGVKFPRNPPMPGEKVYRASKELLDSFYHIGELPIHVGTLLTRDDVSINLNPKGFLRHMAIIGQTGSGKSYTTGVIIEELYDKGASIVIIDPHADYVRMNRSRSGDVIIPRFSVFRNSMSVSRFDDVDAAPLTISLKDLMPDEIANIIGISSNYKRMIGILSAAIDSFKGSMNYEDLKGKIESWARGAEKPPKSYKDEDAQNVLRYLTLAEKRGITGIFSEETTPLEQIIKPKHISVLDLSGLKSDIQEVIANIFLTKIYEKNTTSKEIEPVFIVIEEAHNFVPGTQYSKSKDIVKKIAGEGRKFGVMLIMITQRPHKIDADALSQANSYVVMRLNNSEDITAVKIAAENLGDDLSTLLPHLNPGEAIIVGPVVNVPAIVKIKERKTQEGGGDIDIVNTLKRYRESYKEEG